MGATSRINIISKLQNDAANLFISCSNVRTVGNIWSSTAQVFHRTATVLARASSMPNYTNSPPSSISLQRDGHESRWSFKSCRIQQSNGYGRFANSTSASLWFAAAATWHSTSWFAYGILSLSPELDCNAVKIHA